MEDKYFYSLKTNKAMQKLAQVVTAWAAGYILMIMNYFKLKITFLMDLFPAFDHANPEHWEILSGTIMNFLGALSFVVGIYIALRFRKKK
jgi:hypothetical protein